MIPEVLAKHLTSASAVFYPTGPGTRRAPAKLVKMQTLVHDLVAVCQLKGRRRCMLPCVMSHVWFGVHGQVWIAAWHIGVHNLAT